ncbi:hypothetical protein EDD15DRAFT_2268523 [Pisolithus albus]|nr:hypothetical protein EDD15DRAFT_2268523 [Pisolithus albus]
MPPPLFLSRAPPTRSTIRHSQSSNHQGDCHLDPRHRTTVPGYGSATVDASKPHRLKSSTGDSYTVSAYEALQLPGYPITPAPLPTCNSDPVGYLSGEPVTARVAQSSGYVGGENGASSIGHTSDSITNHDTTLPPSYTCLLPPFAIEQLLGHSRESGDVSTFGYLDNHFAGTATGPGSILSLRDRTSGQVIGWDAPWPWISKQLLPSLQELYPLDDFTHGNIPLPLVQTRITMQPTERIHPWTTFPYAYPIPPRSNSTSYSTSDRYISSQNTFSWFPQEHLGYPVPVRPHDVRPVDLPGIDVGSKMELHTSGTLDDHAAQVPGDHSSHTLPDHETRLLRSHATPDNHTTAGGVDDCGNFDESRFNSEQVVGPQLQLPLDARKGRSLPRNFHHTRCPTSARSRPTRLPKTRSVRFHNGSIPCGWRDDKGKKCSKPISYGDCTGHFASAHGITNIAWNVKITCRWCPSEPQKVVTRKNFLRHMKEKHLCCARSDNGV